MCRQIWKTTMATGLEKVSFHSNPKEGQCQRMFNTTQLHSFHMIVRSCSKSFKLGFNSKWTENFQMYKLDLEGRGTRNQIANIHWIIEKAREFQKNMYFCFIDYAKAFGCVDQINCGKFFKRWEYQTTLPASYLPLTHLLRNLYAGQEATVRTGHGTTD